MQPQKQYFLFFFTILTVSSGLHRAANCKITKDRSKITCTIIVDQNGRGNFRTIQAAIDSVPSNNDKWIKIQMNSGTYTEQVTIPPDKPYIVLEGKSRRDTTIAYNAHHQTNSSATFTSMPNNVLVKRITFKNSYNHGHDRKTAVKRQIKQAVAARVYGDKSAFYECGFIGVQDTLWDVQGRHYFYNCYIEGAIDFIFGNGQSVYERCALNASVPSTKNTGYVTAQSRASANDPSGFVFRQCIVFGNSGAKVFLGRAYGPYSRVIFICSTLTSVVNPLGWDAWYYQGHEDNFTYGESNCRGKGSDTSKRVSWEKELDRKLLNQYKGLRSINRDGWIAKLPHT